MLWNERISCWGLAHSFLWVGNSLADMTLHFSIQPESFIESLYTSIFFRFLQSSFSHLNKKKKNSMWPELETNIRASEVTVESELPAASLSSGTGGDTMIWLPCFSVFFDPFSSSVLLRLEKYCKKHHLKSKVRWNPLYVCVVINVHYVHNAVCSPLCSQLVHLM